MNILISGGTGFIGTALVDNLLNQGHQLILFIHHTSSQHDNVTTVDNQNEITADHSIDVIINLAGAPISQRWTESYKTKLLSSRLETTTALIEIIKRLEKKPALFISASAIGYYGAQNDESLDETSPAHDEFTHQLCKQWETAAKQAETLGVRVCITRLGVVLGKNGGALQKMTPAFKFSLGGKIGNGKHYFSWVHLHDVLRAFDFLIRNKNQTGVFNLTAPTPVTNAELTSALGAQLKRPTFCTMPSFIVKLLFGEMGETLLTKGQRVIPKRLLEEGFKFQYSEIQKAIEAIFS
jgi:uncharacterized protein (TIGR01777 family)